MERRSRLLARCGDMQRGELTRIKLRNGLAALLSLGTETAQLKGLQSFIRCIWFPSAFGFDRSGQNWLHTDCDTS